MAERGRSSQRVRISSVSGLSRVSPIAPALPAAPAESGFLALPQAIDPDDAQIRRRGPRRSPSARPQLGPTPNSDESWPWRSLATAPDGFMAPRPPEDDSPLPANGTGWLIGVGGQTTRAFPRALAAVNGAFPLASFGPSLAKLLHLPGLAGALLAGFAPLLSILGLLKLWAHLRVRRQVARAAPVPTPVTPGRPVRLRGTIVDQPTIASLFRGRPAVLSRNRVGAAEETRGIDFWLQDPTGERVRVHVRGAFLLDRPTRLQDLPVCDPVSCDWSGLTGPRLHPHLPHARPLRHRLLPPRLYEAAVGPGDEVEICGVVDRLAGPEGMAGPGRGTPMYWAMRGSETNPLLVRRVTRP